MPPDAATAADSSTDAPSTPPGSPQGGLHAPHGRLPAVLRARVPEHPQVAPQVRPALAVQELHELPWQRLAHDRVPPSGGPHAEQPQLQDRVGAVRRDATPLALVLGHDLARALVQHADAERADGHRDLLAGVGRPSGVSVDAAEREHALPAAPARLPAHALVPHRRQLRERRPVLLEELELGHAEPVVPLLRAHVEGVPQQPLVERLRVVHLRHRHEQVPAVVAHLRLDVAPLVARVRVGERVAEAVVGGEPSEHLARPDLPAHPPPDLGGVVEDGPRGHAAHELEHVAEPLAHALRRLVIALA